MSQVDPKQKLVTLCVKLIKISAKLVLHACSIIFQLAEVAVPGRLWEEMLTAIAGLRPVEQPSTQAVFPTNSKCDSPGSTASRTCATAHSGDTVLASHAHLGDVR